MHDLHFLEFAALAELIRTRAISPVEITVHQLDRSRARRPNRMRRPFKMHAVACVRRNWIANAAKPTKICGVAGGVRGTFSGLPGWGSGSAKARPTSARLLTRDAEAIPPPVTPTVPPRKLHEFSTPEPFSV
jgi:hypothetical protein